MKVLLFRGRGFISGAIRCFTRSQYSHAALWFPERNQIFEAWQGAGVRFKEWENDWRNVDAYDFERPLTSHELADIIAFCRSQDGSGYDYWGIVGFITRRPRKSNKKWFCSELVYAAFQVVGIDLLHPSTQAWEVSPGMLAKSPRLRLASPD